MAAADGETVLGRERGDSLKVVLRGAMAHGELGRSRELPLHRRDSLPVRQSRLWGSVGPWPDDHSDPDHLVGIDRTDQLVAVGTRTLAASQTGALPR